MQIHFIPLSLKNNNLQFSQWLELIAFENKNIVDALEHPLIQTVLVNSRFE